MSYRKVSAGRIFNGLELLKDQVVVLDRAGKIEALVSLSAAGEDIEFYEGILSPGFINCHCHIELSHLKARIPAGKGLIDFLISIVKNRAAFEGDKTGSIAGAEKEMWDHGIAGVGDICNTTDALPIKTAGRMRWHSFVEVINFFDVNLERQVGGPQQILEAHLASGQHGCLSPHAPYSVSGRTMEVINEKTKGGIISIHNQETSAEDALFIEGTGDFLRFYKEFGNNTSPFPVTGTSSLRTWLPRFTNGQTLLLVHNTYIGEEDIVFAKEHASRYGLSLAYCLCPNANLYIENHLPPVELLVKHGCTIVLGTDSYSSNWKLDMASEMNALKKTYTDLTTEMLLRWATINGADVMNWKDLGRMEKGCRPGIIQVMENEEGMLSAKRII
jgi:cytosine/adenosine deaminase-related metal-dependent hydrolase